MSIIFPRMVEADLHSAPFDREPVSGRETVFAPIRKRRPHSPGEGEADHACPFCPGNEHLLTEIRWELGGAESWRTRVVANRYPIVAPPAGSHEVVIETPRHGLSSVAMSRENWRDLLTAWDVRYRVLAGQWRYVAIYRNDGYRAGETIGHLHSHLLAMSHVPAAVAATRRRLQRAFRHTSRCLLCAEVVQAGKAGRIVSETEHFAFLLPAVPEVSFEVWIVPRRHSALFALDGERSDDLAGGLRDMMGRMDGVLGRFDHNMMLEGAGSSQSPSLHWYLRLRPRLEFGGGFEMATGISVNASNPEEDAAALREAGGPP